MIIQIKGCIKRKKKFNVEYVYCNIHVVCSNLKYMYIVYENCESKWAELSKFENKADAT